MFSPLKFLISFFLVLASTILLAVSGAAFFPGVAFAEGDSVCKGSITGTTFPGNVNGGVISFDSHPGPGVEDNEEVDLSIIGQSKGLAPALREHAACVEKEDGTYDGVPYQYSIKGWAWNTNLGFFSFNCKDGINIAGGGDGVECGDVNYGVQIAKPAADGDPYKLFGYAWNAAFGWVSFNGSGSEILSTDENSLSVGVPKTLTLNGTNYTVTLTSNAGTSTSSSTLKVGSSSKLVKAGETITFGSGSSAVNLIGIEKVGGAGGYFKMKLQTPTSIDFDYGVEVDSNGLTSGYAWTNAGIWLNMAGLTFQFPDSGMADNGAVDGGGWCEGKTGICVEISPDPSQLKVDTDFSVKTDEEPKIADGTDGYNLHLYLKNSDGTAMNTSSANVKTFTDSIKFNWEDTVKINQVDELAVGEDLNELQNPWSTTESWNKGKGAITWKPLKVSDENKTAFTLVDFDTVANDSGHYISKQKISSYAPTTESNVSYTTSTEPVYTVENETFLYNIGVGGIEENQLILKNITFDELKDASGNILLKKGVVYPNGKVGMPFKFMPAVNVDTLYAGTAQDNIMAYRSIPENIKVGVKMQGNLPTEAQNNGDVAFKLKYSVAETSNQSCEGNFDFHFLTGLDGKPVKSDDASNSEQKTEQNSKIQKILDKLMDIQIIAELPGYDEEDEDIVPCAAAAAPALYSEIAYQSAGNSVKYFGNKLPRIAGSTVFNPIVVVHGNIAGQMNVDIRYNPVNQITRNVATNAVRDTIHGNLAKRMGGGTVKGGGSCKVTKLGEKAETEKFGDGICTKLYYKEFSVGDENVLYFKGSNVYIALDDGTNVGTFDGKWVIVNDGGNIFINNDIYNENSSNKTMVLVTFRGKDNEKTKDVDEYFSTGNVYIAPCKVDEEVGVKNIQAVIFSDGAVFSYDKNESPLNDKGEPQWNSYSDRINALNCQLLIEGAVYSKNTIGGADLDKVENPKEYLLLGGGEVIMLPVSMEERMRAQAYDLNYLRTFRLDLEIGKNGCPIDQKCGNPLCAEEIKKIANGETVCGDKPLCDTSGDTDQKYACDGINPFEKFSIAVPDGDLVLPENSESTAKGLDPDTNLESIYVFQKAFTNDSFVFTK